MGQTYVKCPFCPQWSAWEWEGLVTDTFLKNVVGGQMETEGFLGIDPKTTPFPKSARVGGGGG